MNKIKNKIIALILLFVVVIQLLLSPFYILKKLLLEVRMEYEMEQGAIQKISIDIEKVQWIKKDKEILIAGKFFDIKSYTIINNTFEATGIFDEEENKLHEAYLNLLDQRKDQSSPYQSILLKFIFNTIINENFVLIPPNLFYIIGKINRDINQHILQQYSAVLTPPPKV